MILKTALVATLVLGSASMAVRRFRASLSSGSSSSRRRRWKAAANVSPAFSERSAFRRC